MIKELEELHIIEDPKNKWLFHALGMISIDPKNATFATQNEKEEVIIILRKHIINNIPWIITTIGLFLLPLFIYVLFSTYDHYFNGDALLQGSLIQDINQAYIFTALAFYFLLLVSYAYFRFIHWYLDIFIITNERYISIDFDILKGRTITDIPLTDIIDISERVFGFFPTVFGYGNIEFKTTSEKVSLVENIPQTVWLRDSLADLIKFIRHIKVVKSKEVVKPVIVMKTDKVDGEGSEPKDSTRNTKTSKMDPALITDIVGAAMANKEKKKESQLINNMQSEEP